MTAAEVAERAGDCSPAYEISLTMFIPGNSIVSPWHLVCGGRLTLMYFRGDSRGFDPDSPSYRVRQTVTVVPDESADADGIKDGTSPANLPGVTKLYHRDAMPVLDDSDDDAPGDCHLLHATAQPNTAAMAITVVRTGPKTLALHLRGRASDPLVSVAFPIDWNVDIAIDAGSSPPTWE